jgi:hypothetical protein
VSEHAQPAGELRWRARVGAFTCRPRWSLVLAFGVALAGTVLVALLQGEKPFFTDSGVYWDLGPDFTVNGHFSLLNFSEGSYALPLISHGLQVLASDFTLTSSRIVKLYNASLFAVIGAVLAPALARVVWPTQPSWGVGRRLLLTALLLVFWSGFLNFPLSDFPALTMALLTLVAVARVDSPGWMLVAGAALGVALNIREGYVVLGPVVVALVAWTWFEQRGTPHASRMRRVLCASLLVVGFVATTLPQSLVAHRYHNTWTFIPPLGEPAGKFYQSGMVVQAYDTYIVNGNPIGEMKYVYPAGRRLLERQPGGAITTTSQYVGLFVSHPLVMGGMLLLHVVNGLDPLYSTPYVENVHNAGRTWGRIAGYLLLFLALLRLLWPAARRLLGARRLRYLLALSLCSATTVPTLMERRFLLPVYLVVYVLALSGRWPNPLAQVGVGPRRFRTPAAIALAFVVYAALVWYISSDAINHLTIVNGVTHETLSIG